jgi:hypothetical protein
MPLRNTAKSKPPPRTKGVPNEVSPAMVINWYNESNFTTDWTSWNFPIWLELLKRYRNSAARILEIGSWEGRSALFFLNYLPKARLCCVDTFEGGEDHHSDPLLASKVPGIEQRFDANIGAFAQRVEKIKLPSCVALPTLGVEGRRFDVAYIDGSHRSADVYSDGALTWPMIARGGIIIFDDYRWDYMAGTSNNPKLGIDAFLKAFKGQYRIIHDAYQIAIEKTGGDR